MYKTCIFCHAALGANERVEAFSVGRRLAFDSHKGRLWAICLRCGQWNLTPIEERWEVVEQCERLFRSTKLRLSSDEIGLARLTDGFELVRIGQPLRPEFAAWRYGREFLRRRRMRHVWAALGATRHTVSWGVPAALGAALAANALGSVALGATAIGAFGLWGGYETWYHSLRIAVRIPHSDGPSLRVPVALLKRCNLQRIPGSADSWELAVGHLTPGRRVQRTALRGLESERALLTLLAFANRSGGDRVTVRAAVDRVADDTAAGALIVRTIREQPSSFTRQTPSGVESLTPASAEVFRLNRVERLAIEMTLHEHGERRALEGELADLTQAWRDAEEIAAIADNLILPVNAREWLEDQRFKSKGKGSGA